jgi:hypothetical protein
MQGTVEIRADQRGPTTGEITRPDTKEKVQAEASDPEKGLKNSKRLMLRFEPTGARFAPGFGVTEGPWH